MRRWVTFGFVLLLCLPAAAVAGGQVKYAGGTVPGLKAGAIGRLDTTGETVLIYEYGGNRLEIPYSSIESFDYSCEVTRHLGVLPAIVVGLLRARQHRHFFRISFRNLSRGPDGALQVAVFEVAKQMPRTLKAVLEARRAVPDTPASSKSKPCLPCAALD